MKTLIFVLCLISCSVSVFGQTEMGKTSQSAGYYVYIGEGDELLINVQIWGQVRNPGLYSLPEKSDMVTLVSLAGGPTENADLSRIKVTRKGAKKDSLYILNLKKSLLTGKKEITILKPGDIVEIMPSNFYNISNFVKFITQLSMVAIIYYQIFGK